MHTYLIPFFNIDSKVISLIKEIGLVVGVMKSKKSSKLYLLYQIKFNE